MAISMRLVIGFIIVIGLIIASIIISYVSYTLHLPSEILLTSSLTSQIAAAVGTILLAYMTYKSIEEVRAERLRRSFIVITKELYRVKHVIEDNLRKLGELDASKVRWLADISLGGTDIHEDTIITDFQLHYKKGLKLFEHINTCNSKIKEYNDEYYVFRNLLKGLVVEALKKRGIGLDPKGYTYVCAAVINDERRIVFVSPEECWKLSAYHLLNVDDHVEAVLVGLNEVLNEHKNEEELSKELTSLYQEIRSLEQFRKGLDKLKRIAKNEVKPCLEKLSEELNRIIKDIMQKYSISEQEVLEKLQFKLV